MATNPATAPQTLSATREPCAADSRTLAAIFRHPVAHNLDWNDVKAFFRRCGAVEQNANGGVTLVYGGHRHQMGLHRAKQLDADAIIELRRFLSTAGWSTSEPAQEGRADTPQSATSAAPDLLAVVDHRETHIYRIDEAGSEAGPAIRPYDPHHFLHHLEHKDQSHEQGQRSPEEPGYYTRISDALANGARIVLVGHGTGKSNAAHHLAETLRLHHAETYRRVVAEFDEDLPRITVPQLLRLAQKSLH